jgi:hypothetical protein
VTGAPPPDATGPAAPSRSAPPAAPDEAATPEAELGAFLRRLETRRRRQRLGLLAFLIAVAAGLASAVWVLRAAGGAEDDADAADDPDAPYRFPFPDDPAALARLDAAAVHERLFPEWIVAAARSRSAEGRQAARERHAALRAAVAGDRNLAAIADELLSRVEEDAWLHARRILVLFDAWNRYLERHDVPYELHATVRAGDGRPFLTLRCYRRTLALSVPVGPRTVRATLLQRVDGLNLRELFLGQASEDEHGARVVLDRVSDFALAELWPLLADPVVAAATWTPTQRALAGPTTSAAALALPPDALAVLRRTAPHRAALEALRRALDDRSECGARYGFNFVPWNGFDAATVARARRWAERSAGNDCPDLQPAEADVLAQASTALAAEAAALRPALETLVAWAARPTAIHEVRHVADEPSTGDGRPPHCPDCLGLGPAAVGELSAYLASFADPSGAWPAVVQACGLLERPEPGPHFQALTLALARLLPDGCAAPAPGDLAARAAALQAELLGPTDPVVLPPEFPARLPALR